MPKMKTPYRILKLKSGEQIIARLKGEERGKIIIERPMVFMTRVIMDPYNSLSFKKETLSTPYSSNILTPISLKKT